MERKLLIWSTIVVVIVFVVASYVTPQPKRHTVDTEGQVSYGSPAAKVDVVVFEEFACVQCRRFHNDVIRPMFDQYIDTKKVRLTIIPVAYLDPSYPAFSAACCIGKISANQMKTFLDHIFQMNEQQMVSLSARELMASYAMNETQFPYSEVMECVKSEMVDQLREDRISLASSLYDESIHMPTILVNGKLVLNADRQAVFNTIENELLKDHRAKK